MNCGLNWHVCALGQRLCDLGVDSAVESITSWPSTMQADGFDDGAGTTSRDLAIRLPSGPLGLSSRYSTREALTRAAAAQADEGEESRGSVIGLASRAGRLRRTSGNGRSRRGRSARRHEWEGARCEEACIGSRREEDSRLAMWPLVALVTACGCWCWCWCW